MLGTAEFLPSPRTGQHNKQNKQIKGAQGNNVGDFRDEKGSKQEWTIAELKVSTVSNVGGDQCLLNTKDYYQKRKELFLIQEVIVNNRGRKRTRITVETTLKMLRQTSLHPHTLVYRSKSHIDPWVLNLPGVSLTSFMFLLIHLRKQNHVINLSSVLLDVCLYFCHFSTV